MHVLRRKLAPVVLALTIAAVTALTVALPITAHATHNDSTIDISALSGSDVSPGVYSSWSFHAATNTITVTNDVTITGTRSGAINGNSLIIDIDATSTVTWEADYTGNISDPLIEVRGSGAHTFRMNSGRIEQQGNSQAIHINVSTSVLDISGGTITGAAVGELNPLILGRFIYVTGGLVENTASGGYAIRGSEVIIDGLAHVKADDGVALYLGSSDTDARITVEGGTVETATGKAISALNGYVEIKGGVVKATEPSGIALYSDSPVAPGAPVILTGGTISATTGGIAIETRRLDVFGVVTVSNDGGRGETAIKISVNGGGFNVENLTANLTVNGDLVLAGQVDVVVDGMARMTLIGDLIANGNKAQIVAYSNSVLYINGNAEFNGSGSSPRGIYPKTGKILLTGDITGNYEIVVGDWTIDLGVTSPTRAEIELSAPYTGWVWDEYYLSEGSYAGSYFYMRGEEIVPPFFVDGPATMTLLVGYGATSSNPFTFGGYPVPGVSQDENHGGSIIFNNTTGCLDIAAGLTVGTYTVVLTASNGYGSAASSTFELTVLWPYVTAPTITSADNFTCEEGTGGSLELTATGTTPFTWALDGTEPAGVTISSSTLVVAASVPEGIYNFEITASNAAQDSATQPFTLTVTAPNTGGGTDPGTGTSTGTDTGASTGTGAPKTGDKTALLLLIAVLLTSVLGAGSLLAWKRCR